MIPMSENETKSTPRPWRYQEGADVYTHIIRDSDNGIVVQLRQDHRGKSEADARLIVRAVNAHDKLVEALKYVLDVGRGTSGRLILELKDEEIVRAALKLAEGSDV